ncbi:MAG: hypothetical protein ACXIVO_13665 [Glycocaulis sp.]
MQHDIQTFLDKTREYEDACNALLPGATGDFAARLTQQASIAQGAYRQMEKLKRELGHTGPKTQRLDKGEFRLLFTWDERAAETAFEQAARAAANAGTATPEQMVYLTMRADFNDATHVNLTDAAVHAALDFYVAFDLLTQERRDYVLTGYRPGEMPEPDPEE